MLEFITYDVKTIEVTIERSISIPPRPPKPSGGYNRGPRRDDSSKDGGTRINEAIRAPQIRLIDQNGEMIGVVTPEEGLKRAREVKVDLVEVSPQAKPPVCKLLNYSKYKYEQQKKAAEARKKQKVQDVKELKIRPTTEEHDYQVKLKAARKWVSRL